MKLTHRQIEAVFTERKPEPIGKHRFFSVLIPFVERDGELCLLFETRAKTMESQPGEVCFPGGCVEPGEDPKDAALRETFEEIGIEPEKVKLIGPGNILYGYANYTLYTYIGFISWQDYLAAKLSEAEVDEIFLVKLSDFEKNPPKVFSEKVYTDIDRDFPYEKVGIGKDYAWRVGNWEIPIYDIDGRIIWGLTARITENLIGEIRKIYKNQD